MPSKCYLFLLDGLGDRSHAALGHKTPLQAAHTPFLDSLAARGSLGLYHAGRLGQPLPSENAHFAMFGRTPEEFPGRGALEALGADIPLSGRDVALLVHLASVSLEVCGADEQGTINEGCVLRLIKDTPDADEDEFAALIKAVESYEHQGVRVRYHRTRGQFGVLVLSGGVAPWITDTGIMLPGGAIPDVQPWGEHAANPAAVAGADALRAYLRHAFTVLSNHPVNAQRRAKGLAPLNFPVTQRAGRLKAVPSMRRAWGVRCLSASSGFMYRGLSRFLGMTHLPAPHSRDAYQDYAQTIRLALEQADKHELLHIHSKAPDEAAHSGSPEAKRDAIAALDRAMADSAAHLAEDPEALIVVAGDHSTPSAGPLIHSGEPVPLLFHGQGVRRDTATAYDEITAAAGAMGTVRGGELMLLILNYLDRAKLAGIMDTPEDQPYYPGNITPFKLS